MSFNIIKLDITATFSREQWINLSIIAYAPRCERPGEC